MKTAGNGWGWVAVVVGFLIGSGAGRAWAATYTWDGDGDPNAGGNWSDTTRWNPDSAAGRPNNTDDVTLPNVTAGLRTITFDGTGTGARTLTIDQTTVGATNRLALSQNMVNGQFVWGVNGLTRNLTPAGTIVIDKGSYDFRPWWGDGQASPTATLGGNVVVNSTGGYMQDMWDGPKTPLKFQGTVNLSSGVTTFGDGNTMTLDTGAVMTLTSGGGASVGNSGTLTVKGTVNGNSTGSLRAGTLILDTASAVPTSVANIYANTFSIRSTTPGSFDLTNSTLRRANNATPGPFEAAASGAGTNFKIGTLTFQNISGTLNANRTRLVNDYANSGDQASEYFLVGALNASGAWQEEFDLNGQRLEIDGGVANYSGGDLRLSNRSAGHGVMAFRTTGGALTLNTSLGVSSGGTLEIIGPASISGFNVYDTGTSVGTNGGTFAFNGNITTWNGMSAAFNSTNGTTTLDISDTNTFQLYNSTVSAAKGATFIVKGHVIGKSSSDGKGLLALGTAKSGATGAPVVTPSGTIIVSGNMTYLEHGLGTHIGRDATLKVGGNFAAGSWWNGLAGAANRSFFADTSTHAGSFIFNGSGGSVQTMEVLSTDYAVITGLSYFQAAGAAPAASQTVTGDSSGATATIDFINGDILQLTGVSGTFEADETLSFSGGGTARAYDTQFAGLDGRTSGSIAHLPIGNLCIGDPAGTNASVKLVNSYNPWGPTEDSQVARNLIVTTNSTFDLASFKMVVALGANSTVAGLITNSVAGGTLTITNGASLAFQNVGVIDVDTMSISSDSTVDFNRVKGSYIRVNGDQRAAFDPLIAAGRILNTGGMPPKSTYSNGDAHTVVYGPNNGGTIILIR